MLAYRTDKAWYSAFEVVPDKQESSELWFARAEYTIQVSADDGNGARGYLLVVARYYELAHKKRPRHPVTNALWLQDGAWT